MDDTLLLSAGDVAGLLRRREISSRELTESLFARIDEVNPSVNAIVELQREEALRQAEAADRRDEPLGPLHGVPMTVKDAFNVEGLSTTWGNPAFKDFRATEDATVVKRLKEAGAIIVGKSNVPFMLGDFGQTTNEIHGTTNNPWDVQRTPGGSSGGSAAALASGMTFLEYGSDLVGSIRLPAAACGVYGLRPTAQTVPLTGFQPPRTPPMPAELAYMSAAGPLARSAGDLRTALHVTAGPDGQAGKAYSWTLPPPRHMSLRDFRVSMVLDDPLCPVTSEVGAALSDMVDSLAKTGVTIREGWPDGFDPARSLEEFGFHVELFFAFQQPGDELKDVPAHMARRSATRAIWTDHFNHHDVFISPVNFTPPIPHDPRPFEQRTIGGRPYTDQVFWIAHQSLAGLPAVSAPIATPGLPIAAQLAGPLHEDDTVITFAELLAE